MSKKKPVEVDLSHDANPELDAVASDVVELPAPPPPPPAPEAVIVPPAPAAEELVINLNGMEVPAVKVNLASEVQINCVKFGPGLDVLVPADSFHVYKHALLKD